MDPINEALVRLVRIALGTSEPGLGHKYSAKEWQAVYGAASKHAILGVLLPAVEKLPEEERPPMPTALQWLSDQTLVRLKNEKVRVRAAELHGLFKDAGFRTHVLKGITLASFYPDPGIRQCGDIDLWVDFLKCEDERRGVNDLRRGIIRFLKGRVKVGEILFHHCDAHFFDDVDVEVHYRPSWFYNPVFDRRFMAFVDAHRERVFGSQNGGGDVLGSTSNSMDGAAGSSRDVVFELVYNMVHVFRHIFHEGVGMRHLMDYFYVLSASSSDERAEAFHVLRSLGLEKFCGAVMYIETSVLGLPEEFSLCGPISAAEPISDSASVGAQTSSRLRVAESYGRKLFDEIMLTGNFGMMDRRNEGRIRKIFRFIMISPRETLCAIPWKCWHLCWRAVHNIGKF
ncbi:MAG: nucleotidyltransferase family protein [Bacteroidales bacterium]|nr:nucleotidyltransferase family protein [Bacteroidales bacterium]